MCTTRPNYFRRLKAIIMLNTSAKSFTYGILSMQLYTLNGKRTQHFTIEILKIAVEVRLQRVSLHTHTVVLSSWTDQTFPLQTVSDLVQETERVGQSGSYLTMTSHIILQTHHRISIVCSVLYWNVLPVRFSFHWEQSPVFYECWSPKPNLQKSSQFPGSIEHCHIEASLTLITISLLTRISFRTWAAASRKLLAIIKQLPLTPQAYHWIPRPSTLDSSD